MVLVGQKGMLGLWRSWIGVGLNQMDPPVCCFLISDPRLLPGSCCVIHAQNVLPYHSCYQSNLHGAEACAAFSLHQLQAFFRLFSHGFVQSQKWRMTHKSQSSGDTGIGSSPAAAWQDCLAWIVWCCSFNSAFKSEGIASNSCCLWMMQAEQFCFVRRERAASFRVKCSQCYSELLTNAIVWLKKITLLTTGDI